MSSNAVEQPASDWPFFFRTESLYGGPSSVKERPVRTRGSRRVQAPADGAGTRVIRTGGTLWPGRTNRLSPVRGYAGRPRVGAGGRDEANRRLVPDSGRVQWLHAATPRPE